MIGLKDPINFVCWIERWNWLDPDYVTLAFTVSKRWYCKNSLIKLLSTCVTKQKTLIMAGFRKTHMRAFCYSIRDMSYRQMHADALYGIQRFHREGPVSYRSPLVSSTISIINLSHKKLTNHQSNVKRKILIMISK